MRAPAELTLLGKTLLNIDQVARALDPQLNVNEAIRRNGADLMTRRIRKTVTSGSVIAAVLEAKEFGEKLPGRWYEESLEPTGSGARVVARFASGAPAAVASSFGKGKALMLGSYVSAGFVSEPADSSRRFYEGLVDWSGASRLVTTTGDPLEVRLLASGSSHLAFVFNHAAQQASATVRVRLALGGRTARDLATGAAVSVAPTADGFEWRESLPAREVRVLVIGDDQAARRKPAS